MINNTAFEYNETHNIALKESDTGTFYTMAVDNLRQRKPYNFTHHTNRITAFLSCRDDGDKRRHFTANAGGRGAINAVTGTTTGS